MHHRSGLQLGSPRSLEHFHGRDRERHTHVPQSHAPFKVTVAVSECRDDNYADFQHETDGGGGGGGDAGSPLFAEALDSGAHSPEFGERLHDLARGFTAGRVGPGGSRHVCVPPLYIRRDKELGGGARVGGVDGSRVGGGGTVGHFTAATQGTNQHQHPHLHTNSINSSVAVPFPSIRPPNINQHSLVGSTPFNVSEKNSNKLGGKLHYGRSGRGGGRRGADGDRSENYMQRVPLGETRETFLNRLHGNAGAQDNAVAAFANL